MTGQTGGGQPGFGGPPDRWAPEPTTANKSDRSTALLAELQAICQRIIANDGRLPDGGSARLPAVNGGGGVAAVLDDLRLQGANNAQQLAELRRAFDSLRGSLATDTADNTQLSVEVRRSVVSLRTVVAKESTSTQQRLDRLQESLRPGGTKESVGTHHRLDQL